MNLIVSSAIGVSEQKSIVDECLYRWLGSSNEICSVTTPTDSLKKIQFIDYSASTFIKTNTQIAYQDSYLWHPF